MITTELPSIAVLAVDGLCSKRASSTKYGHTFGYDGYEYQSCIQQMYGNESDVLYLQFKFDSRRM